MPGAGLGCGGASGTTTATTQIAASDSAPTIANNPPMPIARYSTGAATSDNAKLKPIIEPIIAITLVRCASLVRSAASATTTEEIAPAPCSERPAIAVQMSVAPAARKLPAAKISKPA